MSRVTLLSCGRCGKPRGLVHECTGRKKGPAFKVGLTFTCGTCGKTYTGSPLGHHCTVSSDFRKRLAAQKRKEKAEERRRKRKAAAARRRASAAQRRKDAAARRKQAAREKRNQQAPPRPASNDRTRHDPETCPDLDCGRYPCRLYRQALEAGEAKGESAGYARGYADGMQAALAGR